MAQETKQITVTVNQADLEKLLAQNTELKAIVSKQIEVLNFLKTNVLNGQLPTGNIGLIEMVGIAKSVMQLINNYKKNPQKYAHQMGNITYIAEAGAKYISVEQIKQLQ